MSLARYSLRELRGRPVRALLTLLGISIGVAAIVAIWLTVGTTRSAYREMFTTLAGRAELEIVAEGSGRFDAEEVATLARVPGVRALVPNVQSHTALATGNGVVGVLLLGIDPRLDQLARDYTFAEGRQVAGDDEIVLQAGFARDSGLKLGDRVRLLSPRGSREATIVGLLAAQGAAAIAGGNVVFVTLSAGRAMHGFSEQEANSLAVVLDEGASVERVEQALAATLPIGLRAQRPASRSRLAQDSLLSTEQGLSAMSAVSLVAGAFVVLNTFLMNLSERRRQMAILRAIGATRRQVVRMVLVEALVLGLAGTALGTAAGVLLSMALTAAVQKVIGAPLPELRLTPWPFVLALVVGPVMSLAATYLPARQAASRSILTGLLQLDDESAGAARRWPALLGVILVAVDGALIVTVLSGRISAEQLTTLLPLVMGGCLVACVLLMPLVVRPLTRLAAWLLHPWTGLEGKLAQRQLTRRPTRTALTLGVLFIAIVVALSMGHSLINNVQDVQEWTRRTITSDFLVRSVMPDTGLLAAAGMPPNLGESMARLPGVARVGALNFVTVRIGEARALLLARDQSVDGPLSLDLVAGDEADVRARLLAGEAVVGTLLARRLNVAPGDTIELATRQGPRTVRVAALTTEYTVGGMALYMERAAVSEWLPLRAVDVFMVVTRPGQAKSLGVELKQFCESRNLMLQSQQDFRVMLDRMMSGVLGSLWLLMALVFVVASLGVVNTLTMNALEQTREFGVLRAIGMQRRQARKMVISEALTLSLASALPGAVVGMALAWLVNRAVYPLMGHPVDFQIEWWFVAACLASAVVISLLASLLPARRVAGLNVVSALQYE
ncbi:MAG: FtsX-like permease family protein [Pirellulales bacterium]|nr:FtsX-like permease family protein [Pirellulales bacterium]